MTAPTTEFNSYYTTQTLSYYFGLDILSLYNPEELAAMARDPMNHNRELREISRMLYDTNATYTHTVDYLVAMLTLDKVVVTSGRNKTQKKKNKEATTSVLKMIKDKEFIRDALWRGMVDGIAFYYFETSARPISNQKFYNDFDISSIVEINDAEVKASIIPLPTDYTRIIHRRNNYYQVAFNLDYFTINSPEPVERKLRKFPKEIRDAYREREKQGFKESGNWVALNVNNTIVHKIRSEMSEPYGRPLVMAAINDILYNDYFTATKRGVLDEINNQVIYQTFPEGKEKGTSALTTTQQENQHRTVKNAILTKQNRSGKTFISVAAGTKINSLDTNNTDIFDSKNEENLNDKISLGLGIAGALLNGVGSGSYAAQEQNLELITRQVCQWVEQIANELNKCIAENIIKDRNNKAEVSYLPITCVNQKQMVANFKDLYLQGCGSLTAWAAACGLSEEVFMALLDHEKEEKFAEKYPPHQTSFTLSKNDTNKKVGRPETDNPTENTIKSKDNNGNNMPSPSDNN
jgi:ribosomal silencing factor RsfS